VFRVNPEVAAMSLPRMPRPDEGCLFVHLKSGREGPLTRRQLAERVQKGEFPDTVHVWFQGMESWARLSDHRSLLEDLGSSGGAVPRAPGEADDEYKDRVFGDLVKRSWDWLYEHEFAGHVEEVFLGAIITSSLDAGFALIDLNSDGRNHFIRFEDLRDKSRLLVRLTHLTGELATAKVLGQKARVAIGYGERVANITKIITAIRAEMQSGFLQPEPGTITVDGDLQSGYVYVQVELFLSIDQYVSASYDIDYPRLTGDIDATAHALRKYLRGRFQN